MIFFHLSVGNFKEKKSCIFDYKTKSAIMKKIAFLLICLLAILGSEAKDVSISLVNENNLPLTIWMGSIPSKDNIYSDDEIVQLSEQLNITAYKRKMGEGRKLQVSKKGLPNNHVLIIYGKFDGGSRTAVQRFYVKELGAKLTTTFEEIKIYRPNKSYFNIVKDLESSGDAVEGFAVKNANLVGMFFLYDVQSDTYSDVFVFDPSIKLPIEELEQNSNEVSDFISKNATAPFHNLSGKLVRKIPEETDEVFTEVVFPGYTQREQFFGDKDFKFLTWSITNSQEVQTKLDKQQFLPLYNSCSLADKNDVTRKFMRQVNKDVEANYHLFYITGIRKSDKVEVFSSEFDALNDYDELLDNDIKTKTGAFRLNENTEVVFSQENMVSYIKGHDITPLLYFMIGKNGRFDETEFDAENLVGIYRELGNYIQLPELDGEIEALYEPDLTISTIKKNLQDPKILESIENRLKEDLPVSIPAKAIIAADKKNGE